VTLDEALRVLSLPREVGVDARDGERVTVQLGRYGPYVSKGKESRSLPSEDALFTITLEEALAVLAQPRGRRARGVSGPLAELGNDPASGQLITLREGPFGLYVTDGEVNASLRRGDTPESVTPERAQELLRLRRERGPVDRKRFRKRKRTQPEAKAHPKPTKKRAAAKAPHAAKAPAKKPAKPSAKRRKPARKGSAVRRTRRKPAS
jgi:DNA topoisomerase I